MKKMCFIVALMMCSWLIKGQTRQVWLHGKVVTQGDKRNIALAQVASYKKMNVFAADSLGEFKVILDANDSIKVFALGFEPRIFYLDSLNVDPDRMYVFPLESTSYHIQQIDVNSNVHYGDYIDKLKAQKLKREEMNLMLPADIQLGKPREIPADIQPVFKRKPPVIAAFFRPLSYIYYHTSKTERAKVKMLKTLEYEKQRKMLTVELMESVSGLKDASLDNFIVYCNVNIEFDYEETPESVKTKVVDLFNEYKKQN